MKRQVFMAMIGVLFGLLALYNGAGMLLGGGGAFFFRFLLWTTITVVFVRKWRGLSDA